MRTTRLSIKLAAVAVVGFGIVGTCAHGQAAHDKLQQGEKPAAPVGKPQREVAAKAWFVSIPASDPAVKKALDAKDLAAIGKVTGKDGAITGTVAKVFAPNSNSVVILNFAEDYKKAVSAIVRSRDFARFPDLRTIEGKRVLINGKIELYRNRPEIVLTTALQLKIVR